MRCVIVTGMSGAGKSTALNFFQDDGYYCVDNIPVQLISQCNRLAGSEETQIDRFAIGIDVRVGRTLERLDDVLRELKQQGIQISLLYLDADDRTLMRRYKETRRTHPLAPGGHLEAGIREDRKRLAFLKSKADYIIDTSQLLTRELRTQLKQIFMEAYRFNNLNVTILSFGFKFGIPADADLVFDVRFLPNPYYVEELRRLTGQDPAVCAYIMESGAAEVFLEKVTDLIRFLMPHYVAEGKNQLVVAVGCTGGRHRSVALAEAIFRALSEPGTSGIRIEHRDMQNDNKRKQYI